MKPANQNGEPRLLEATSLGTLCKLLINHGFDVIGPQVRDGAMVLDRIEPGGELPGGWTDEQSPGHYRLQKRDDQSLFGYAVGPHSWKKYLHPADVKLLSAERQNGTFRILNDEAKPRRPLAFLGVRACDLAAIAVQDRVLTGDQHRDSVYQNLRTDVFMVAVQCTHSVSTCFCASMGTGPGATSGFDLCLTELAVSGPHHFIVRSGSHRGGSVLAELPTTPATPEALREEEEAIAAASRQQVRSIDTSGIKELLYRNFDSPRWETAAARCLTCANCTLVCPTCFCTTVEDTSDLTGDHAERWRRWDSCFTLSFSYIHGGSVRASAKARYRQWMTHKLASWIDQFGTSGCVGCGRCITWCPVGIDLTESVRTIREGDGNGNP